MTVQKITYLMLDEDKRLNLLKFKKAFQHIKQDIKKKTPVQVVIKPMPIIAPIKVSTLVHCFHIESECYLNILARFIPVYDLNSYEVQSDQGQIVYVKNFYSLPRGWSDKPTAVSDTPVPNYLEHHKPKLRRFPNQVTITFRYCGLRNISAMIFSNGSIKIAGTLSNIEGQWVACRIAQILAKVKVNIYTSYGQLPLVDNIINDFALVLEKGHYRSYRWLTIDDYTSWVPIDTISETLIDSLSHLVSSSKNNKDCAWYDLDLNFNKLCYFNKIKDLVDETGRLKTCDMPTVLGIEQLYGIKNYQNICLSDFKLCMINSDFSFDFTLKTEKLRDILTNIYHVDSSYGYHGNNAVKCQYKWNPNNIKTEYPGMCQCPILCYSNKNRKEGGCKIIMISIYHNGKTIISGASNHTQLMDVYLFITKVVTKHYNDLYKPVLRHMEKKMTSGRTNVKNKKRTVITLEKKFILNKESAIPPIDLSLESD